MIKKKKDFKNHIKSNPKTKNIIQNSFKYIIDSNSTAFGINSCAEDLSSLCFNNKDNYNDKPIKLENISDSPNGNIFIYFIILLFFILFYLYKIYIYIYIYFLIFNIYLYN